MMQFDLGYVAAAWRRWEQQYKVYMVAAELSKKPEATRVAILLHSVRPEALDIFSTFQWEDGQDQDDTDTVLQKFRDYCQPRKNTVFECYTFWDRNQQEGESIDQWVTDLKNNAATCEFGDQKQFMIRDKIIFGERPEGKGTFAERWRPDPGQSSRCLPCYRKQQTATPGSDSRTNTAGQHQQHRWSTKDPQIEGY